jgi:hypothetical protein
MAGISLVIQKNPEVWVPVTLNAPVDGGFNKVQIELNVALENSDKIKEIFKKCAENDGNIDQDIFIKTVIDWRGVGSDADTPLAFNKTNTKAAINNAWFVGGCAQAILNAHNGITEVLEKN